MDFTDMLDFLPDQKLKSLSLGVFKYENLIEISSDSDEFEEDNAFVNSIVNLKRKSLAYKPNCSKLQIEYLKEEGK